MKKSILLIVLFLHFFIDTKNYNVIYAKYINTENRYSKRFLALVPLFKKYGLIFVEENPDVILCNRLPLEEEDVFSDIPIILLERKAGGGLREESRKALLNNSNLLAIFKNRVFKDKKLHNKFICGDNNYHFYLVNKYAKLFKPKKPLYLNDALLNKIHCVLWSLDNSPFSGTAEKIKDIDIDIDNFQDRPIDVFFVGTVYSKGESIDNVLYTFHREKLVEILSKITGRNIVCVTKKSLDFNSYIFFMKHSKIVVSPWGFGEWSYRDYEGMHCGAVVIKPDTSFLKSIPDIYQNNVTYVPCKEDFSDLPKIINVILNNQYLFVFIRKYAKKVLLDSWDIDKLAENFVIAMRKVFLPKYVIFVRFFIFIYFQIFFKFEKH